MQPMYYIGLDVHKRTISYCVKDGSGAIHAEGTIPATRFDLDQWLKGCRSRGRRRWKPRCLPAGSTITCCRTPPQIAARRAYFKTRLAEME
jgi:hypothetical protein